LVGGHSIEDAELKYGLSVTGLVHPDKVLLNAGARPGDVLLLTKPIGTGILSTAIKGGLAGSEIEERITEVMVTLNKLAAEVMDDIRSRTGMEDAVHACTDITGFGLLGHLHEMLERLDVSARLFGRQVPVLDRTEEFARMGIVPAGAHSNRKHFGQWIANRTEASADLEVRLSDPQTSGGLLIAVTPGAAEAIIRGLVERGYILPCAVIGEITAGNRGMIHLA